MMLFVFCCSLSIDSTDRQKGGTFRYLKFRHSYKFSWSFIFAGLLSQVRNRVAGCMGFLVPLQNKSIRKQAKIEGKIRWKEKETNSSGGRHQFVLLFT